MAVFAVVSPCSLVDQVTALMNEVASSPSWFDIWHKCLVSPCFIHRYWFNVRVCSIFLQLITVTITFSSDATQFVQLNELINETLRNVMFTLHCLFGTNISPRIKHKTNRICIKQKYKMHKLNGCTITASHRRDSNYHITHFYLPVKQFWFWRIQN